MTTKSPRRLRLAVAIFLCTGLLVLLTRLDLPGVPALAKLTLAGGTVLLLSWGAWRLLQRFLHKVGRRLAFSYFLLGVLPIPMVSLLLLVCAYLLAGFFLGHLYRDAVRSLQHEVALGAESRLQELVRTGRPPAAPPETAPGAEIVFGYYRDGRRIGGDARTPAAFPGVQAEAPDPESAQSFPATGPAAPTAGSPARGRSEEMAPFLAGAGENAPPRLAASVSRRGLGVVALYAGDLEQALSERSDVWVEIIHADDPDAETLFNIQVRNRRIPLQIVRRGDTAVEAKKFFRRRSQGERFWNMPCLWWGDVSGKLVRPNLAKGGAAGGVSTPPAEVLQVSLHSTPRVVLDHLFSASAELDTAAWAILFGLAFLLFDIYVAAAAMAVFMIFGLSRAVNRLSRATAAVQNGDFSVRLRVRRRDQLGDLERSFNEMAANLETLVATAAQKEALETELGIARELQKSLIPSNIPTGGAVEFATLFEPSAAIGGDYFDILRLDERRLAVIIADVSGHGLSTGLRMAMLKAALLILVQDESDSEQILRRLDAVVRADTETRFFVTATLSLLDFRQGTLEITNAGHPPTYRLRPRVDPIPVDSIPVDPISRPTPEPAAGPGGGRGMGSTGMGSTCDVEEIVLPGSPLGGLGSSYGRRTLDLQRGDIVVWLSDGLIEATNADDEPFGYDAVVRTLEMGAENPAAVRDRLLTAIDRHAAGRPPSDDRTLVVMRYLGGYAGGSGGEPPGSEPAAGS